ncbi:MAG: hypothetical protein AAF846_07525 [Chloroflexota bacterium]
MGIFRRIGKWFGNSQEQTVSSTSNLRTLVEKAHLAQYTEDYETALSHLDEAFEIAEKHRDTRSQIDINLSRADILIAQGDYETARFVLAELRDDSEARHLNAPLAYSLCSLGVLEQKLGNTDIAQEHFEKARDIANAINTDGASGRATGHLGDIYIQQENISYGVYLLEDAVEKLERSKDLELLGYFLGRLGMGKIQLGERSQGELHLKRGLDIAKNIQHTAQIRQLNILIADNAFDTQDYRQAQSHYSDAFDLYSSPQESLEYASLLGKMSRVALKLGDTFNAERYAEEMLPLAQTLDNDMLIAKAKALIGLTNAKTQDNAQSYLEDAVQYYRQIEPDSFYIDILRTLAQTQLEVGDDDIAIATYQDAIKASEELSSESAKVHSELATYYASKRQLRDAIDSWQVAVKLFEDAHQINYMAGVHCDIALMYDQLGDGRLAQREYGIALEMLGRIDDSHTRGIILANVAAAYSSYGDVDSAEDFFSESIQIARRNNDIPAEILRRCNYGRLLALTNRPEEALKQLAQTQEQSAEYELDLQAGIVLGNMGLVMAMLGEVNAANMRFQQSLSILSLIDADQWRARVYANWADFALQQDEVALAKERFDTAFKLAQSQSLVDVLIQTIIGRANLAIQDNRLDDAEDNLTKIMPTAKRQGYQQLLAQLHQAWSMLYAKQGKQDQAQSEWATAQHIRDLMKMPLITPDWL